MPRARTTRLLASWLALGALVATGCSQTSAASGSDEDTSGARQAAAAPVHTAGVVVSTGRGTLQSGTRVRAGTRLDLQVTRGRMIGATLLDARGSTLPVDAPLPPRRDLTLSVRVTDDAGTRTLTREFRTSPPPRTLRATVTPWDGLRVGVGQPVIVEFNHAVRDRAAVERALSVDASRPTGAASWSWLSDTQVQFRPRRYWPEHTRVTVSTDLADVRAGRNTWGARDTDTQFTVGRHQVLRIRNATHRLTVLRGERTVRTMGVSMGKPGYTTRSGTKVIMTHERWRRMSSDSVNIGGSEAYDLNVPYSMRITNSGEFLHGAPWNPNVGAANVSHGCTNLDLSQARWLFNNSLAGDPVETRGTGRAMEPDNGWGGAWNVSWPRWVAGSALS
jgi:lipoprotein-anchoring transpeptidase ErfK/SrfK